jgi:predicted NUDIX family phosphoesterase
MLDVATEQVLVVPTEVFHRLGHFQGFSRNVERYLQALLDPAHTSFRPRSEMETDPSFKQLIPYVVFRHAAPGQEPRLFCYTRGTGQGEGRLHRKRSIGVGGHISTLDVAAATGDLYRDGMRRELDEEVAIDTAYDERCVGLINDDETEVGRVHLGVVHVLDLAEPRVQSRETDLVDSGFFPVSELLADLGTFESWSRIVLEALFAPGVE